MARAVKRYYRHLDYTPLRESYTPHKTLDRKIQREIRANVWRIWYAQDVPDLPENLAVMIEQDKVAVYRIGQCYATAESDMDDFIEDFSDYYGYFTDRPYERLSEADQSWYTERYIRNGKTLPPGITLKYGRYLIRDNAPNTLLGDNPEERRRNNCGSNVDRYFHIPGCSFGELIEKHSRRGMSRHNAYLAALSEVEEMMQIVEDATDDSYARDRGNRIDTIVTTYYNSLGVVIPDCGGITEIDSMNLDTEVLHAVYRLAPTMLRCESIHKEESYA